MLSNWSSGEDSWEYLGLQGTDNKSVDPDGNEIVRKYWEFLIINDKLSRGKYRSVSMAHHKASRKIKEIGASMWGSLLQLHFCITPNLICYPLQVLFMKHRHLGSVDFQAMMEEKQNTATKTNQPPLWKVKDNLLQISILKFYSLSFQTTVWWVE